MSEAKCQVGSSSIAGWKVLEEEFLALGGRVDARYIAAADAASKPDLTGEEVHKRNDEALRALYACIHARASDRLPRDSAPSDGSNEPNASDDPQTDSTTDSKPDAKSTAKTGSERRLRTALCFSGGGIRSATFNLGVMQSLAQRGLLDDFDYLSTVSGGGYVGSWFSSWRLRARGGLREEVIPQLATTADASYEDENGKRVKGRATRPMSPTQPEAPPIRHLRRYSRYLSPKQGFLSADVWTLAVTYSRNLTLNWLVLIPLLAAILILPRFLVAIATGLHERTVFLPKGQTDWVVEGLMVVGLIFAAASFAYAGRWTPGAIGDARDLGNLGERDGIEPGGTQHFLLWCWAPLVISSFLLPIYLVARPDRDDGFLPLLLFGMAMAAVAFFFLVIRRKGEEVWKQWYAVFAGGISFGAALMGCALLLREAAHTRSSSQHLTEMGIINVICFGPPLVLLALSFGGTVYVGCASFLQQSRDPDREWWARFGAWAMIPALGWAVFSSIVLIGPDLLYKANDQFHGKVAAGGGILGVVASIMSVVLGRSSGTPATGDTRAQTRAKTATSSLGTKVRGWALSLAAPAAIVAILIALSLGTSVLMGATYSAGGVVRQWLWGGNAPDLAADVHRSVVTQASLRLVAAFCGIFLAFGLGMSFLMRLNKFSMHAMYRNRLIRAYLGASRHTRTPNPFTGFDERDNIQMHELRPEMLRVKDVVGDGLVTKIVSAHEQRGVQPPPDAFARRLIEQINEEDSGLLGALKRNPPVGLSRATGPGSLLQRLVDVLNQLMVTRDWSDADTVKSVMEIAKVSRAAYERDRNQGVEPPAAAQKPDPEAPINEDYDPTRGAPPPIDLRNEVARVRRLGAAANRLILQEAFAGDIRRTGVGRILGDRPFHLVNMALNLVSGDDPAWQDRKAESFTASPLHAGAFNVGYRRSARYGGHRGMSLGSAITISGAAVSPNMGYHSSPTVALLMTFFNVRLGWWLGNPGTAGDATIRNSSPSLSVWPLIFEALGLTNDKRSYVYLSDGGHFENLGLYEMVRRRAHVIVLCDASQDQRCALDDLGRAIRQIRADLGVPIVFCAGDPQGNSALRGCAPGDANFAIKPRDWSAGDPIDRDGRYCAIAEIDYAAVDGAEAQKGVLVYIKPSIYGREPVDVLNYASTFAEFPHESTADQFFAEAQFESYRALGRFIVENVAGRAEEPIGSADRDILAFVHAAAEHAGASVDWFRAQTGNNGGVMESKAPPRTVGRPMKPSSRSDQNG